MQELIKEDVEGTFVMTCGGTDTEVRYTLNAKKIIFNEVESTLLLIRDTSHVERAYRKIVEEKYRGVLLSTITHELKTPLTIMSANLALVHDSCKNAISPDDQAHLEVAMLAAKSLKYYLYDVNVKNAFLTPSLQDIRQLVEGNLHTTEHDTNLRKFFARLEQFVSLKARARQIGLEVHLEGWIPRTIRTDKRRLMQVLLNLCYNSIKYTFKGEVTVRAKMQDGGTLRIEVSDTGIGIEPSVLASIFSMFSMIEKKANEHQTGTP